MKVHSYIITSSQLIQLAALHFLLETASNNNKLGYLTAVNADDECIASSCV